MANFSKRDDPIVVTNLSSDHATMDSNVNNTNSSKPLYKANTFDKKDSSSFHQEKVLYQSNLIPDYNKLRNRNVEMPKEEYTEEKVLKRPIADKDRILSIDKKETTMPSFSKSVSNFNETMTFDKIEDPLMNPVTDVFQNASTSNTTIPEVKEEVPKNKKRRKRNKWMKWVLLGILIELIVVGILLFVRNINSTSILECASENYNSYYEATIKNVKKYYFKNGTITKLIDTTSYVFDSKETYTEYKTTYGYPDYEVIEGRIVNFNINDNTNTYEEKFTYDYKKLRRQNQSSDEHTILIESDDGTDIDLIDYNPTDIQIIYQDDYICR